MKTIDIQPLVERLAKAVDRRELAPGKYARHLWQGTLNAYGCADAANILYTLNRFPRELERRANAVSALRALQNPESGLFTEGSHHVIHTTAHCTAALELYDALPLHPFTALRKYEQIESFCEMLREIDWLRCGKGAHPGAGLYAALVITEAVDDRWRRAYFDWFNQTCDPETGFWVKRPAHEDYTVRLQLGDAFHYYFTYEHAHEPFPYLDALIDSALSEPRIQTNTAPILRDSRGACRFCGEIR